MHDSQCKYKRRVDFQDQKYLFIYKSSSLASDRKSEKRCCSICFIHFYFFSNSTEVSLACTETWDLDFGSHLKDYSSNEIFTVLEWAGDENHIRKFLSPKQDSNSQPLT